MITEIINNDALAIVIDSESIKSDYIIYLIRNELKSAGIVPWEKIEAEIYVCDGEALVMARPASPLCRSGYNVKVRRTR